MCYVSRQTLIPKVDLVNYKKAALRPLSHVSYFSKRYIMLLHHCMYSCQTRVSLSG